MPPPTTIYGLLSNVLGLARGDYRLQELIQIAIRKNNGEIIEEYAQLLKEPKSYFPEHLYRQDEYTDYLCKNLININPDEITKEELQEKVATKIKNDGYKERSKIVEYSTSPMKRRIIVDADYTVFVASDDNMLLKKIYEKLMAPERPLYLGPSDSIAVIYGLCDIKELKNVRSFETHTACKGIYSGGILLKLP
jgi:CRISPR/Cas system-associated protein Cas5 (RAMP superfamily)